ncbi:MAG: 3',5'-cyclic-nucleotide phosphodiesterase [Gammaproteobacteria bacterium]|nr:MAG: 3',5'-cyclic-nucleotide phosphodiesterase [Gammaproteobacteria bacterium]
MTTQKPTCPKTELISFNILQLSDLHLSADKKKMVNGINGYDGFNNTLRQALSKNIHCDLILLTGDLVNEINPSIYDYIFTKLTETGVPFACIAGNHDVTDVLKPQAKFEQPKLIACKPDPRLLNQHLIETDYWQILLINSSIAGKIYGNIDKATQHWLNKQLANNDKPAIIVMHHHSLPIGSKWMDKHILKNADDFWQTITPFKQVKAVISGHTHQQSQQTYKGVAVYTTPSTNYQYKPKQDDFAYDELMSSGYRWIKLYDNGTMSTTVERLAK